MPVGDSVPTSALPPATIPDADQPPPGDGPPAGGGTPTAPDSEWCLDPESPGVLDVLAGLGTDSMGLRFVAGWWDRTTVADGCPSLNWVLARGDDQDMRAADVFYLFFDAEGHYLGPSTPEYHTNSLLTSSTDNSATILYRSKESLPDESAPAHESTVTYTLEGGTIVVDGQLPGADWG
ncbi:LppP/LprE family lipoprotein [Actinomycetes bacterium M1A6_2h]